MLPACENLNCFEYLKKCTSIYPDVDMMQHFGVRYKKSKIFEDIEALSGFFQKKLGLRRGDVFTVFMPTTIQSIVTTYALSQIGVIVNMARSFCVKPCLTSMQKALWFLTYFQRIT